MTITERLGAFYLGKAYDLAKGARLDTPVMYDARDLTTHAVCVGMTGSGKTGLCIDLLEEAALDEVPAIIIDPKGDITNLLLTFPELRPEDFQPWINLDDARRKDMTPEAYAAKVAEDWRNGLADWDQGPERIKALKDSADFVIYTPGSEAGLPVSVLSTFEAPELSWETDGELLRERISGTTSALLGLAGITADPVRSREHILIATIFEHTWRNGENLNLAQLIGAIQKPPVRQLGVMDVDTFFPEEDRFELAMALNGIMASPSFATWLQGTPLDAGQLLYGGDARPNVSIFYIAHLSDAERMFFVTLLLQQIITWMRTQSGTTSLRALLYMDEVFGYFPPTSEPPSKRPMLTLLKQGRAFGLGVVLTTQNPVDLDYKGLTNAGTWFIGKLQAERDKERMLAGLEGVTAAAGGQFDGKKLERLITSLGNRVFLLHNVHADGPLTFQTRWAMSYLRGPMTRDQVRELMADQKAGTAPAAPPPEAIPAPAAPATGKKTKATPKAPVAAAAAVGGANTVPPVLPSDMPVLFLPARRTAHQAVAALESQLGTSIDVGERQLVYLPQVLATGSANFVDSRRGVREAQTYSVLVEPPRSLALVRWDEGQDLDTDTLEFLDTPEEGATFVPVPDELSTAKDLAALSKDFQDYLARTASYALFYNPVLKLYSLPGERERDFKIRAQQLARERRDAEVDKITAKFRNEIARFQERLAREQRELEEDRADHASRKQDEVLTTGTSLLGMLFGRRRSASTMVSSASRRRRATDKARADIAESEEEIDALNKKIAEVQQELQRAGEEASSRWAAAIEQVEPFEIRPSKSNVSVYRTALAWAPHWRVAGQTADGRLVDDLVPAS